VDKNLLLHLVTENELNRREIAELVGCSAERVRQLELKFLRRTGHEAQRERRERRLQASFERNEFVKAADLAPENWTA
jgi:DNA-directed RNA polymerase specialized sigma subunit